MTEVEFCNANISHSFALPTMRNNSLITHFLTPQDVHIKDGNGNSPLHFAVASNDIDIIQLLLNTGAMVNDSRMDGLTPLHIAIVSGKEENVKLLLNHNARLDIKDLFGKTPLHHLAACINYYNEEVMLSIARLILQYGIDVKTTLNECTDSGETALHYAIINGSTELIKLFLQYGANVNAKNRDGKSPLYFAIEFNNLSIAKVLLRNGARVNDKMNHGLTALHEAITRRAEKSVRLLLSYKAEVNAKDIYGKTPLHLAARLNYLDERTMDKIVKLLLDKGADVNDYTNLGETAFHCAVVNGNEKLVRLFLEYGADVNMKNYDGKSPLHFAIQYSNKNIVKLLLDRGANIDERTNDGKLALHVAVAVEDENMMKILLEYNADVNAIDKSGKTPLSLAFEVAHMRSIYNPWNGFCPMHTEIGCDDNMFELLVKHIAKLNFVCEENQKMIVNSEKLNLFYRDCQAELTKMKENKVCDNISMYKVLTKSMNIVVGYTRNANLSKILELDLYANEFPIYYQMLRERFYKAESRKQLLESSTATFRSLVKPFSLPDLVTNEILSYLTMEDLVSLKIT
ncbi:hypothetical protein TSAR_011978 [Trichomalopsis sarcophagae]|uniref:F-box domain-containing protein n=1 Tax=Trichomalopsis sarcophagae TaxID=543379 RepID=A0A232FID8_9HYME|nr:hypothetical protein TSAR_011978 [Trichomalopsis sarcophagae]